MAGKMFFSRRRREAFLRNENGPAFGTEFFEKMADTNRQNIIPGETNVLPSDI
jgi:hypothetical protein